MPGFHAAASRHSSPGAMKGSRWSPRKEFQGPREMAVDKRAGVGRVDCVCHHSGVISHLQACDRILTICSAHNDTPGRGRVMEKFFSTFFFFFFYDFSKDINILIFHRRIQLVKHTSSEASQPFKVERITKVTASESEPFQPKSCYSEVICFSC